MIRKIPILAVVRLLFATLAAGAASVSPSSAADYIFTTPLFPASIRGEVMGDPPAYYDVRGEDVDWMYEALEERFALINGRMQPRTSYLVPEFGTWALSETNRFYSWSTAVDASGSTNVVVGYNLVTNATRLALGRQDVSLFYGMLAGLFWTTPLGYQTGASSGYRARYIDSTAPLQLTARVAYDYQSPPSFTNFNLSVAMTNSIVTNVTEITMPMTNGTTSVFTNRWTATFEYLATNTVTNVVEAVPLDYCHAGTGPFPGFPEALNIYTATYWARRYGFIGPAYTALRSTKRLADEASPTNKAPPTIAFTRTIYEDQDGTYTHSETTTNSSAAAGTSHLVSGRCTKKFIKNADTGEFEEYDDTDVYGARIESYTAHVPTRFTSEVITTGQTARVEIAAAFAVCEITYSTEHQAGSNTNLYWVSDTNVNKVVVVPISSPSLDTSLTVSRAMVTLSSQGLCASAATAAGVPSPPDATAFSPPVGTYQSWSMDCDSVVLIYTIHPTSKFADW